MSSICLVHMNYSSFPYSQVNIGLASIYSFLRQRGHRVYVYDTFYHSARRILEECKRHRFAFVGFSTTEIHSESACSIAKDIHDHQGIKIIFGGPFPTICPEHFLSRDYIDYVCVGDGEYPLDDLLNGRDPESVSGIWYRKNGEIIQNGISRRFNIDDIEITDYGGFPRRSVVSRRIFGHDEVRMSFSWSSRGCAYSCGYCSNAELRRRLGYGIRFRKSENLIKEIEYLAMEYHCDGIFLSDEDFLYEDSHYSDFAAKYRSSHIQIPFGFLSRPEHINHRSIFRLNELKDAGWRWVGIGVETGNQGKRSSILNRNNSNEEIIEAFNICKTMGVHTNAFLIAGFYFEDYADLAETEALLRKCQPGSIECSLIYPFRGTDVYKLYDAYGLLNSSDNRASKTSYFDDITVRHPVFSSREIVQIKEYWEHLPKKINDGTSILDVLRKP